MLGVPPRVAALSAATAAALQQTIHWIVCFRFALASATRAAVSLPTGRGNLAAYGMPALTAGDPSAKRATGTLSPTGRLSQHGRRARRKNALPPSRFSGARLPLLTVIARCTNVRTNASSGRFARAFDLALRGLLASFRAPAARGSGCAATGFRAAFATWFLRPKTETPPGSLNPGGVKMMRRETSLARLRIHPEATLQPVTCKHPLVASS